MKKLTVIFLFWFLVCIVQGQDAKPPIRLAIIGLAHDAVGDFIQRAQGRHDVQLVGIVESNRELTARYGRLFNFNTNFFSASLNELLAKTNAQAAVVFTSTFDHRRVVELCAAHGMDLMLEKPLAVNMEQALAIADSRKKGRHSSDRGLRDSLVSGESNGIYYCPQPARNRRRAKNRGLRRKQRAERNWLFGRILGLADRPQTEWWWRAD